MPDDKAFSIRTHLQGELVDFIRSSGFDCPYTDLVIRDAVCLLGSYREEGVQLFPDLFFVPKIEAVSSLAPGTQRVAIGRVELQDGAASAILKDCAALAVSGWAIYVCKVVDDAKPPIAEYGLFRARKHSFAASAEEGMITSPESPTILVRNRGHLVVEVANAKNIVFTASFTSAQAGKSPVVDDVTTFAEVFCTGLEAERKLQFAPYAKNLLHNLLQHCHGTLLAVHTVPVAGNPPESLSDGVWLRPALDLASAHSAAVSSRDAESLATLQSCESLLAGMINSDGVVVFSDCGTILGYRIFLKPSDEEKRAAPHKGGGRRRTYELMKNRLGTSLKAALFRSQDGTTECARSK